MDDKYQYIMCYITYIMYICADIATYNECKTKRLCFQRKLESMQD